MSPKPAGLIGALGVTRKRLPGEPLPPPDPNLALELTVLALRWDELRGWVEVRRRSTRRGRRRPCRST